MNKNMIIEIAEELVINSEEAEFFDNLYKQTDWYLEEFEGNEEEGFIYFAKDAELGYTQFDFTAEVLDTEIEVEEFTEMFDLNIIAKVYYIIKDGMIYFNTCRGATKVDYEQDGFEDIYFEEDDYPEFEDSIDIYQAIEEQLADAPEGDPQGMFDTSFNKLLEDRTVERPLDELED